MKKCNDCKQSLSLDQFYNNASSKDGKQPRCIQCHKVRAKDHYQRNKASYAANGKRRKDRFRALIIDYLSDKACVDCGESDSVVLEFDHRDPSEKSFNIARWRDSRCTPESLTAEMNKCDIRCANCHRRKTSKQFDWIK